MIYNVVEWKAVYMHQDQLWNIERILTYSLAVIAHVTVTLYCNCLTNSRRPGALGSVSALSCQSQCDIRDGKQNQSLTPAPHYTLTIGKQ